MQVVPLAGARTCVLVGEERLIERETAGVAAMVEHAHQMLERHVLAAERLHGLAARRAQQFAERTARILSLIHI